MAIRTARIAELETLNDLIQRSMRELGASVYTPAELECVLLIVAADVQLIRDATYYVIEQEGWIVACGGWSFRQKLFGGEQYGGSPRLLDPATEPARLRAFFVEPAMAGRSLGTLLLQECERQARLRGFRQMALAATRPGEPFYARRGYREIARVPASVPGHVTIELAEMIKEL